jgi:chromosome segregation ATPase
MLSIILTVASASLLLNEAKSLDTTDKEYPVSKVIRLLKDMQATLVKEGEQDQEIYEKLACWCETNDKEKTAAIDIAQKTIASLESEIEELTAKSERLNSEIETLNEEIAKNQDALNKASAIREEELAEFNAEEKETMQAIQALTNAITVLSKHHEMPAESLVSVASIIRRHWHKIPALHAQNDAVSAFLQQPAGFQSYAPASGQIFGILKQMKETFESNLSQSQKDELAAQEAFSQLKASKLAEIAAAKKQLENKTVELAETDEALATAKTNLEETKGALSADEAFLLDLKEKCKQTDEEMAARTKTRNEEILAVSEAIKILNDDDAHDMFSKTMGFVQVNAVLNVAKKQRREAVELLKAAAKKSGSAELQALAITASLDAFKKVIAAIDEMAVALEKEKADEIKHRDFCIAELAGNDKSKAIATDEKGDLEAKIANLASTIDTLKTDIATKESEVAEMNVQIKRASEDRELENREFQSTVADQRATQEILNKALARLQAFYDKKDTALLQSKGKAKQTPGAAAPPPPPGFEEYSTSSGAGGVVRMLQGIIHDAKTMENEAIQAEADSQGAYESFVKNTNDSLKQAGKALVSMGEDKAKAEEDKVHAEADMKATLDDLENLAAYAAEVHKSCDFVMDNFEIRQAARDQEVEALKQAKAVLSGADFK